MLPDNPLVKGLIWFAGIAVSISMATAGLQSYADSRYHPRFDPDIYEKHADALARLAATDQKLDAVRMQVEYSADQNAKRAIDNELFKLDQIPPNKMTPSDRAVYEKLKRERQELIFRWNRAGRPLR